MYTVKRIEDEMAMVKAMFEVLDTIPNKERFSLADVDEKFKTTGGYTGGYRIESHPHRYWNKEEEVYFTGSSLKALAKRGIIEVIDTEDYIYVDPYDKRKRVGTRTIYRMADDVTFEDYKSTFAELLYKKIMAL